MRGREDGGSCPGSNEAGTSAATPVPPPVHPSMGLSHSMPWELTPPTLAFLTASPLTYQPCTRLMHGEHWPWDSELLRAEGGPLAARTTSSSSGAVMAEAAHQSTHSRHNDTRALSYVGCVGDDLQGLGIPHVHHQLQQLLL